MPAGARESGLSRAAISRSRHAGGMVDRMIDRRHGIHSRDGLETELRDLRRFHRNDES
jgi:hypothetical protein